MLVFLTVATQTTALSYSHSTRKHWSSSCCVSGTMLDLETSKRKAKFWFHRHSQPSEEDETWTSTKEWGSHWSSHHTSSGYREGGTDHNSLLSMIMPCWALVCHAYDCQHPGQRSAEFVLSRSIGQQREHIPRKGCAEPLHKIWYMDTEEEMVSFSFVVWGLSAAFSPIWG